MDKANNRIEANGLHDMMGAVKQGLLDKNKNVLKSALHLLANLAAAMGTGAKLYNKLIITVVLNNLSDKQSLVKKATLETIESWAKHVGVDYVVNLCGKVLKLDNPDIRTSILTFLMGHKDELGSCECGTLVKPLISCL